jgi:hypothetical protein
MGASSNFQETLRTAVININTSGDNVIIAAPATTGDYIAIDFIQIIPTTAVTITFYSGPQASGTALTGPYPLSAQQVVTDENVFQNQHGIIECPPNTSFNLYTGGAVQCGGFIRYRIVGQD